MSYAFTNMRHHLQRGNHAEVRGDHLPDGGDAEGVQATDLHHGLQREAHHSAVQPDPHVFLLEGTRCAASLVGVAVR